MRKTKKESPKTSPSWFKFRTPNSVETVTPFPGCEDQAGPDGLFDDCPLCQKLRAEMAAEAAESNPQADLSTFTS